MLGVKGKFMLVAALIVTISSAVWGCWIQQMAGHLLLEKLQSQARLTVISFRDPIIDALIEMEQKDFIGSAALDNIIDELVNNGEHRALYAYITDLSGKVVATDNMARYGKVDHDPLVTEALKQRRIQQRVIGNREGEHGLLDLAMPLNVQGKNWGSLRVSFSLRPLHVQLDRQRGVILNLTLIICLVEMAVFYVVGLTMTRPLKGLAGAMASVDPVLLSSSLVVDRRDEIGVLQKSFRSMLDRLKQSEFERQRAINSLVQHEKLAIIGKIAAGVAHEVNNPLAGMTACIYNLKQAAPPEMVADLGLLSQACAQIQSIVQQLLDFNRAGQLTRKPVPSDTFLQEVTALAELSLTKMGTRLMVDDRCAPPLRLTIDKAKLTQVALNILMNAAEASPPGDCVAISAYTEDGHYCLAVRDHGDGIPPEQREKIFELFYTMKTAKKGNGIGLAICRNIVDMHNGTIVLDSKPGETIFTVMIPLG